MHRFLLWYHARNTGESRDTCGSLADPADLGDSDSLIHKMSGSVDQWSVKQGRFRLDNLNLLTYPRKQGLCFTGRIYKDILTQVTNVLPDLFVSDSERLESGPPWSGSEAGLCSARNTQLLYFWRTPWIYTEKLELAAARQRNTTGKLLDFQNKTQTDQTNETLFTWLPVTVYRAAQGSYIWSQMISYLPRCSFLVWLMHIFWTCPSLEK